MGDATPIVGDAARRRRGLVVEVLCVAVSAGCLAMSTGVHTWWPLAWLAPAPLLGLRAAPGRAWVHGVLAYWLGTLGLWPPLVSFIPAGVLAVGFLILAACFGTTLAASAWIAARVGLWGRVLAYPVAATAMDFFLSRLSPDAATWSAAYSQTPFLPVLQVAAVAGPGGVVFLLALLPSALAAAVSEPRVDRRVRSMLAWTLAVEAAAVAFGVGRLTMMSPAGTRDVVRVGVAASDPDIRFFRTDRRDEAIPVVQAYARRVRELAARGAQLVVLPEKFTGIAPAYRDEAQAMLADAARAAGVWLVAGLNLTGGDTRRNVAWVFAPTGRMEREYDKRLLVPHYEDGYQAGTEPAILASEIGPLGVAICKDLQLPQLFHAYARAGVRILLAPAWDFTTDAAIQARMPVLRAIEGGYPVVRAAQEGLLVVTDAAGRVLLRRPSWEEAETLAVVEVPLGSGRTPYARLGDWTGGAAGLALVGLIVRARRRIG